MGNVIESDGAVTAVVLVSFTVSDVDASDIDHWIVSSDLASREPNIVSFAPILTQTA